MSPHAVVVLLLGLRCAAGAEPAAAPAAALSAYQEGARLYREGRHAEAAQAYEALLRERPDDPFLHYNLANARYKQGQAGSLGRATAGYWRAWRLNPRDPDIRHNLELALRRSGESLVPAGTPAALHRAYHALSRDEILGLQWLGYWACLLLGAAYVLWSGPRERLKPWLIGALAAWALAASWWGLRWLGEPDSPGVVIENNAEARSGPGPNFPVSFNAPEGRRVTVVGRSGDWLEVGVLKEGLKGWVRSSSIEIL